METESKELQPFGRRCHNGLRLINFRELVYNVHKATETIGWKGDHAGSHGERGNGELSCGKGFYSSARIPPNKIGGCRSFDVTDYLPNWGP